MLTPHHYCYDFYNIDSKLLTDVIFIEDLIDDTVKHLTMTPVGRPQVEFMQDPDNPTHCGITAVQIIKESLIDIHTYGESGCIYISVFSCRKFDPNSLYYFLCNRLGSNSAYVMGVRRLAISDNRPVRKI